MSNDNNPSLFEYEEYSQSIQADNTPVVCLGKEFPNEGARREYFRAELRKKLPELKKIEGFPIGEDDDIINLSDPPYYTACPNPWLNDFIAEWEKEKSVLEKQGKRKKNFEVKEPYASDVSEGKNNPIYNAHSYHTKVPHPAIMKLLLHYTQPGDIIYDGFAGTGMTGIAAGFCGNEYVSKGQTHTENIGLRHCVCSDLSPIASFISYNLNLNNSKAFNSFYKELNILRRKYSFLYKTKHFNGDFGEIKYIVWSDLISCPNCGKSLLFWDIFVRHGEGKIDELSTCPHCSATIQRKSVDRIFNTFYDTRLKETVSIVDQRPVLISYVYNGKRFFKKPDEEDLELYESISNIDNNSWYPTDELIKGDKMGDPNAKGIFYTHHFYNQRTLFILSKIWEVCKMENYFCVTNSISRNLTKLNRFIVNKYNLNGRINGPLSGTLYIPSEVVEQNVFDLLDEKHSEIDNFKLGNVIQVGDALNCKTMPDESVDYVFTDPPFGHNIMYSELNFLSESWLKVKTNNYNEAIENKAQNKTIETYKNLMTIAFKDYYRILKPGKWLTVEFSNPSASIWNAIQTSIIKAGFIIATVTSFDKVHGGQKAMRYAAAVKEDLIITAYKPDLAFTQLNESKDVLQVWDFIAYHLNHLPVHLIEKNITTSIIERSSRILHDRMISYYITRGHNVPIGLAEFQKELSKRFIERDGMFFTASQALEYEEKRKQTSGVVSMGLLIGSEADGIAWLNNKLQDTPKTYQDLQPDWMKDLVEAKKGDVIPELQSILEENFIKNEDGRWRKPDPEKAADLEALRNKRMAREFATYLEFASKPKAKRMKDCRLEVLRYGFKECYKQKDFKSIVLMGDHIQEALLQEDEVLLQYYDIALERV